MQNGLHCCVKREKKYSKMVFGLFSTKVDPATSVELTPPMFMTLFSISVDKTLVGEW